MPKAIIAIIQTIIASIALYRSRGDQIEYYGYASFGLTLFPYILMSIINLITAVVIPDYPKVFIVSSRASELAIAKGGFIEGTVGRLYEPDSEPGPELLSKPPESNDNAPTGSTYPEGEGQQPVDITATEEKDHGTRSEMQKALRVSSPSNNSPSVMVRNHSGSRYTKLSGIFVVSVVFGAISIGANGILSHFHGNHSSTAQRVWTMMWLVFGIVYGPVSEMGTSQRWFMETTDNLELLESRGFFLALVFHMGVLTTPAIGGFAVVGQMLKDYGTCTRVPGLVP
ncbi:MAG: hypothetical protein LQ351_002811 [Letrouitia transgressa]|nr:MAG: hypothetical protein LQ351_002811 [Letrouitia transgressa]